MMLLVVVLILPWRAR